jgi:protein-disulfide isomerase
MGKQNEIFKLISFFLIGLILGFTIAKIPLYSQSVSSITLAGSVKVMGNDNAPLTMTEYSDFQCPLCKQFFDQSLPTLKQKYIDTGKLKLVYKQFPLNIHPQAPDAALASECALEQNKFWEMHDSLFKNQSLWAGQAASHLDTFKKLASDLGMDQNKFADCLDKRKYDGNVNKDYQEGISKNVTGTPTFYLNDQVIIGAQPTQTFIDAIEAKLRTI